jgi:uncharacterized lipoprotein NlpE involved in copper resistance
MKLSLISVLCLCFILVGCNDDKKKKKASKMAMPSHELNCAGTDDNGPCRSADGGKYIVIAYMNKKGDVKYVGAEVLANASCADHTGCVDASPVKLTYDVTGSSPKSTTSMVEGTYQVIALLGAPTSATYGGVSPQLSEEFFEYAYENSSVICMPSGEDYMAIKAATKKITFNNCFENN